jgi:hypothetical protein
MIEKIRIAILILLSIFCITGYMASFMGPEPDVEARRLASERDELDIIDY